MLASITRRTSTAVRFSYHRNHPPELFADRGRLTAELAEPGPEGWQAPSGHHVQVGHDVGQRIVDLVRDAGRQRPHRDHPVREEEARLHLLALG
jgi:hypothetical protein